MFIQEYLIKIQFNQINFTQSLLCQTENGVGQMRKSYFMPLLFALSVAPVNAQSGNSIVFEAEKVKHETPATTTTSISESQGMTPGNLKYKQRVQDLADQIKLVQSKGFISSDQANKFLERQSTLAAMEAEDRRNGYPKAATDQLEKAITLLNEDLFKASHKNNPIKSSNAQNEAHDPNLIPAYPDADLQPGSGHVSPKAN